MKLTYLLPFALIGCGYGTETLAERSDFMGFDKATLVKERPFLELLCTRQACIPHHLPGLPDRFDTLTLTLSGNSTTVYKAYGDKELYLVTQGNHTVPITPEREDQFNFYMESLTSLK